MNVRLIVSIVICIVVIATGTFFFANRISPSIKPAVKEVEKTTPATVTIKDSFKKGTHTISGVVTVATPCIKVATDSNVEGNIIHITVTTTPSEGICLMRSEDKDFTLKVSAPESATIQTVVDGVPVTE